MTCQMREILALTLLDHAQMRLLNIAGPTASTIYSTSQIVSRQKFLNC